MYEEEGGKMGLNFLECNVYALLYTITTLINVRDIGRYRRSVI